MRRACIVQARMGSSRLPGKVLMDLGGQTVLAHVLTRCAAIPGIDVVVCATVDEPECDPVAEEAARWGAVVFRGSEADVLDRYYRAAQSVDADLVMRVTSDCPLIDPALCGEVLAAFADEAVDYATNNFVLGYPHGLDCEAFRAALLQRCWREATESYDREHVSPWMRRDPDTRKASLEGPGGDMIHWRWTLDYPEDLAFFRAVAERLPPWPAMPDWQQIAEVIQREPELALVNAERRQR